MAIELPEDFDRDDINQFVDDKVTEEVQPLQDQVTQLQKFVDILEKELQRVAGVVRGLEDK